MNVHCSTTSGKYNQEPRGPHHSSDQQCCMIKNLELTYDICNINLQRNKTKSKTSKSKTFDCCGGGTGV